MQSPNICSQNQWICQQQLSFWRKLLISFFSWWANSTMFVKELRALLHNGALKPHSMTRTSGLRNGFLKNSQTTVDSKLIAIDSEWKFFAGCWHVLNAVANALRISAEQNITGLFSCLFPEQLITLSDSDLQDQLTKPTKKSSNDVSSDLYRQLLAFRACAGAFIQKAKDPQDVLNVIMSPEMSVCFPDVVTVYTIFLTLPVSAARNEHSFSELKLLNIFARSYVSR